jgi:hypothetical protein
LQDLEARQSKWRFANARPDPDLQEWDYGGYEGRTTAQIRAGHPGWYLWQDGIIPGDAAHPGETVDQVGAGLDVVLRADARYLFDGLTARALPVAIVSTIDCCAEPSLVRVNPLRYRPPENDPLPPEQRGVDLIAYFFFYHDTAYLTVDRAEMNRKMFAALKPGGLMIVADHSAKRGDGVSVARTLHRIEESVLRREVEAAGFKLIEEGNFLRQPQDPRDFSVQPVTPTRPPVDEFVLKFQKPQ